ncbi:MAG: biotin--[acetyl-CoA-carboxylase] ligase, partial [Lachnospiraceae bacterium]|nr:biotin--[acetyl-CoA-carboxylase] ligase [Lachnospiraceae bacterium]
IDTIDSTNEERIRRARAGAGPKVLIAREQSAGRGRLGRSWISTKGEGLYMSILIRPEISITKAPLLSLIMGLAAERAIKDVTSIEAKLKWPNDLVIDGKKVAGILAASEIRDNKPDFVVIGIGINMFQEKFSGEIAATATSLKLAGGTFIREDLENSIVKSFNRYYDIFICEESFRAFAKEYNSLTVNIKRRVRVIEPDNEYEAEALGVNEEGELMVRLDSGDIRAIRSGEVSVRGVYGYI